MGLGIHQSSLYYVIGIFSVLSIGSVFLLSDSNTVAALGEWQTIVVDSVTIDPLNQNIVELSLTAAAPIPHVETTILAGFGWMYADESGAYVVTVHRGVRDSTQNPDNWHSHNITFEKAPGAASVTHCITSIDDDVNAGIAITTDVLRVEVRNSEIASPLKDDPPTAISFDVIPDMFTCASGFGIGLHQTEPAPAEEEGKKGGGGNPNK